MDNKKGVGSTQTSARQYGAGYKLIGKNYVTPDLYAKVTGQAKYAEDFRAEGMLFCKLLLSPMPHARVKRIHADAALAMPGVKGILTADDLPAPADTLTDNGTVIKASKWGERGLTNEPLYHGEPILRWPQSTNSPPRRRSKQFRSILSGFLSSPIRWTRCGPAARTPEPTGMSGSGLSRRRERPRSKN